MAKGGKKKKDGDGEEIEVLEGVPAELWNVEHSVHAAEVIESYIQDCSDALNVEYLKTLEGPYAAGYVLNEMLDLAQWNFLQRDQGESEESLREFYMDKDTEPDPCPIDTWARGMIPVKAKSVSTLTSEQSRPGTVESRASYAPSESGKSKRSVRSRRPGTNRSARSGKSGGSRAGSRGKKGGGKKDKTKEYIISLEPLDNEGRKTIASRTLSAEQKQHLKRIADLERKEKEQKELTRKREEQQRMEKERLIKLEQEVKGKQYFVEEDGTVVIVKKPDIKKLPPRFKETKFRVEIGSDPTLAAKDDKDESKEGNKSRGSRKNRGKRGRKKKKKQPKAEKSDQEEPFFAKTHSFTQRVSENNIKLRPGVTLIEAGKELKGPPIKADPDRMTRTEYDKMHKILEEQAMNRTASPQPDLASPEGNEEENERPNSPQQPGFLNEGPSPRDIIDPVDEHDADARPDSPDRAVKTPPPVNSPQDPNLLLTEDPAWGQSAPASFTPGAIPKKPNSRQRAETLGKSITMKPRDRRFIETTPAEHKQHLPPPVYPSIVGHGGAASPSKLPAIANSPAATGKSNLRDDASAFSKSSYPRTFRPPKAATRPSTIEVKSDRYRRLLGL